MSKKNHIVCLSADERARVEKVSRSNRASVREKTRARTLLLSDVSLPREQGASRTDAEIAEELHCAVLTVSKVRQRAGERGVVQSMRRAEQKKRKAPKLDGRQEAQLVALTCSPVPKGHARWSLVLLREKMIEMQVVEHIGLETIRSTLKKTRSSRGSKRCGASHLKKMRALWHKWRMCSPFMSGPMTSSVH